MRTSRVIVVALLCLLANISAILAAEKSPIEFRQDKDAGTTQVLIDGKEAFVYQHSTDVDLTHLFPVRSPGGKSMTSQKVDNRYPHHRSVWFADTVNLDGGRNVSFYGALYSCADRKNPKPPFKDHIRHIDFSEPVFKDKEVTLTERLVWEMDNDKPVMDETRDIRLVALGKGEYFLDITFKVTAAHGDVNFVSDSVHYAWPYVRLNPEFCGEGGGRIVNSEGGVDQKETDGKVADWVDYSNTVEGETSGLAMFSHSDNAKPHLWLTRGYGCFGPRREHAKSGKKFTIAKGDSLTRRVGILVHSGDLEGGKVAERYRQYCEGKL